MLINLEPLAKDISDAIAAIAANAQLKADLAQAKKDLDQASADAAASQAKVDELEAKLKAALAP